MEPNEAPQGNRFPVLTGVLFIALLGALAIVLLINYTEWSGTVAARDASIRSFNNNDLAGAVEAADALLRKDPTDVEALLAKAIALAQEGSLTFREQELGAQAAALAEQALVIDPKNDEAWRILGYTHEIRQNYTEAHKNYASAFTLNPRNAKAISQDGHAYDLEGDVARAAAQYQRALDIDPLLDQANMGLARILLRKNDLFNAQKLYLSVLSASPNLHVRAEAAYSASSVARAQGAFTDALSLAKQATQYDPQYALGWVGYGKELFMAALSTSTPMSMDERRRLADESFDSLKKAIELNPDQSIAHVQLASQLAASGQVKPARNILEQAKKMVPNDITLSAPDKQLMLKQIQAIEDLIQ